MERINEVICRTVYNFLKDRIVDYRNRMGMVAF